MPIWFERKAQRAQVPATARQIDTVRIYYGPEAAQHLSMNRAIELLSVRDYVRGAAHICLENLNGIKVAEPDLRAVCLRVHQDSALREFIERWAARRFSAGTMGDLPTRLRLTPQLKQVVGMLCRQIGAEETWHDDQN